MTRLINILCTLLTVGAIILSCSKKGNSRTGEEDRQSTVTTTSGTPSTTGSTTSTTLSGQATGTIAGSPTCSLNPRQVISSDFINSTTVNTSDDRQISSSSYQLYNFNSSYFVNLYFNSTMAPATGGYSVVPNNPTTNQVSIEIRQNISSGYVGYGQNGVVYVTNTGTAISAVFCDVPCTFNANGNTFYSIISAKIEK